MPEIRNAAPEDGTALLDIYKDYILQTAITFEWDVPSVEEFEERIRTIMQKYPYLVLEDDGKIMGYAYAGVFKGRRAYDWSAEVSIYLRMDCRGKGYGRILFQALEEACRKAGLVTLYSCVAMPHDDQDPYLDTGSYAFHSAMGFVLCGRFTDCAYKFDRWYDMVWMEKRIQQPTIPAPYRAM